MIEERQPTSPADEASGEETVELGDLEATAGAEGGPPQAGLGVEAAIKTGGAGAQTDGSAFRG